MMIIYTKRTMVILAICSSRNDIPIYSICIYTLMYLYDVHVSSYVKTILGSVEVKI